MGTVYILGAGFSKTCGIATDLEMLGALNPLLKTESAEDRRTSIDFLLEQSFHGETKVGFEYFMSTLSSLKFAPEYLGIEKNIFEEDEIELQDTLIEYIKHCLDKVNWEKEGKTILKFVDLVNWEQDFILTFNYDLLLEKATKKRNLDAVTVADRIIHLHGKIGEPLAWPTYMKFVHQETRESLSPRWKRAFNILFHKEGKINKLVFVGYSMPPSDLEAKTLFIYTDWYNKNCDGVANGKLLKAKEWYAYEIIVVNPAKEIEENYKFFRKKPKFILRTLEDWLSNLPAKTE